MSRHPEPAQPNGRRERASIGELLEREVCKQWATHLSSIRIKASENSHPSLAGCKIEVRLAPAFGGYKLALLAVGAASSHFHGKAYWLELRRREDVLRKRVVFNRSGVAKTLLEEGEFDPAYQVHSIEMREAVSHAGEKEYFSALNNAFREALESDATAREILTKLISDDERRKAVLAAWTQARAEIRSLDHAPQSGPEDALDLSNIVQLPVRNQRALGREIPLGEEMPSALAADDRRGPTLPVVPLELDCEWRGHSRLFELTFGSDDGQVRITVDAGADSDLAGHSFVLTTEAGKPLHSQAIVKLDENGFGSVRIPDSGEVRNAIRDGLGLAIVNTRPDQSE